MKYTLMTVVLTLPFVTGCVKANPPTDTGDSFVTTPTSPTSPSAPSPTSPTTPTTPTTPTAPTTTATPVAYTQDLKAVFQSDCVSCHGSGRADGGYRMTTYAQVMTAVRAGSASSVLVRVTAQNGSMYRYWSGSAATRQSKAALVRSWIVDFNAQENR